MIPPKKSKRKTSKLWLAINTVLSWAAIFYAIHTQQGAIVVASLTTMIGGVYGAYVGVGYWDFKQVLANGEQPMFTSPEMQFPPPPEVGHE